jgi:hypothetical protein
MRRLTLVLTLLVATSALGWNDTGHQLVAGIAWDNMTPGARQQAIAVLQGAPSDACLLELFPADDRPLDVRQREFFMRAATWPDKIRPDDKDPRPCQKLHRADWHFFDRFWEGESGGTQKDRNDVKLAAVNAVERLTLFRPLVVCNMPACGTSAGDRAIALAWMLHLTGDIHQPLHTSGRVTATEPEGDQGGNLFLLSPPEPKEKRKKLHGFWDGIIDSSIKRDANEENAAYLDRVIGVITSDHPPASLAGRIESGDFDGWSRDSLGVARRVAYPHSLKRGVTPSATYKTTVFNTADEQIALGGYRLADLLNRMFGP